MNILETIIQHKKKEVASSQLLIPISELKQMKYFNRTCFSLKSFLIDPKKTGIITEFKRKSPSKGTINDNSKVEDVTKGYSQSGASALSILTDFGFFGGSVDDILAVRDSIDIPILRKEFIIDEYQIFEAKAIGADAILLIAAVLTPNETKTLAAKAHELGLQVLLELHDESELAHVHENIDVVGVNNRNLKTFEVSLEHSVELAKKIPAGFIKISESGIASAENVHYLKNHGFDGFLIGENFMKHPDPAAEFLNFVKTI